MASTELLASKIVILEEEPSIPAITALPSAVCLCLGITERGPIADPMLLTSFEEYVRYFGAFVADSDVAVAAYGFFHNGGTIMWVCRTTHFTDLTDPATYTAAKGSVMLQTSGTADSPGSVTGSGTQTFVLSNADHLDIKINGGGATPVPVACTAPVLTSGASYPIAALAGGETMGVTVNGLPEQTVTAVGGEASDADIAAMLNNQISGINSTPSTGVTMQNDRMGTGSTIQITTPGTLNAILIFPTSLTTGTGNVANNQAITGAEIEAMVEALVVTVDLIVNGTGTLTLNTVAVGATESIQIDAGSSASFLSQLGLDTNVHSGADATPENTLLVRGKTPGAYTADIMIGITAASSAVASEFNLQVIVSGVVRETFPNVTMGDGLTPDLTMKNYVETIVNNVNLGSNLISVTDQTLAYTATLKRPVTGTSAAMTGGDDGLSGLADSDFIGNQAGPTGLRCFDRVQTGRLMIVPGKTSAGILLAMVDYAETTRLGSLFCILDCPASYTAAQMVAWMDSSGLTEYSEFAAIYWPRIKVVNPSTAVFGTGENITIPTSGWIAGKYASNDQKLGGVYEQPAGIGEGYGIIRGVVGLEDDPGGGNQHEVLDELKRDLIAPKRINPITRLEGTTWHIDGGETLKSTGNFPNIGERRGVIFIEQSIKAGLIVLKHRFNNKENRRRANRIITKFLLGEMGKDAFRTKVPATAFFVDTSDKLNPLAEVFAGKMKIRIGLATNKPNKFIVILVTQDTRALQEELAA